MKKLSLIAILAFLLSACTTNNSTPQTVDPVSCSSIAKQPASSVPVLNIELPCADGKSSVFLNEIKGPAIINAWASWCEPCREEIPILIELSQWSAGQIQIIGIDVDERKKGDGIQFASEIGMNWPQLYDNESKTVPIFGKGIPVTLFIDSKGRIVYTKIGYIKNFFEIDSLIKSKIGITLNKNG